tara:strand:- start:229 stop:411 length:183 start_codon:yes stop_codon:yes gene_type:complete
MIKLPRLLEKSLELILRDFICPNILSCSFPRFLRVIAVHDAIQINKIDIMAIMSGKKFLL